MSTIDFNALSKAAEDAGFDTTELESGNHDTEVKNANYTEKSNGNRQFGFRFVALGGPQAGVGVWKNLNIPDPAKATDAQKFGRQVSIFLRELKELGVDEALAAVNPQAAAEQVIGRCFNIDVKRTRAKAQGGGFWTDVDIKSRLDGTAPVTTPPPAAAPVTPAWQQTRPV